jgi:hypothetical protein
VLVPVPPVVLELPPLVVRGGVPELSALHPANDAPRTPTTNAATDKSSVFIFAEPFT